MPTTSRIELDKLRPLTVAGPGRSLIGDSPEVDELRIALAKAIAFAELGLDLLDMRDGEMSASARMSRAIRQALELYGPRLIEIETEQLLEMQTIVAAFAADMQEELERRR